MTNRQPSATTPKVTTPVVEVEHTAKTVRRGPGGAISGVHHR